MARKLNRNLVGVLTLVGMLLLAVTGFALLANLPGQDPKVYEADAKALESEGKYDLAAQTYARAYAKDPAKNPEYLVMAARCALTEGRLRNARDLLKNALVRDPLLRSALEMATDLEFELAQKFPSSTQWNRVLEHAQKLGEVEEDSILAAQAAGNAYLALTSEDDRNEERGEKALRAALQRDPGDPDIVDRLARHFFNLEKEREQLGDFEEANAAAAERAAMIEEAMRRNQDKPTRLAKVKQLDAVLKLLSKDAMKQGLDELKSLVKDETEGVEAHLILARIYSGRFTADVEQDLDRAVEILKRAMEIEPDNGVVYIELGTVYNLQRNKATDPAARDKYRDLEVALYKDGLEKISRTTHFRSLQNNIARTEFLKQLFTNELNLANEAADDEAEEAALAAAEKYVQQLKEEVGADDVNVRFLTANLLNARGKTVEATKEAEAAERLSGTRGNWQLQVLLGQLYARQKQWGAAESAIRRAISLAPSYNQLILDLAQIYLRQEKASEALVLLRSGDASQRSEFLRKSPIAARLRSEAYRQLKRFDDALDEVNRISGDNVQDEIRAAQLLMMNEQFDQAEPKLRNLLSENPGNLTVLRTLAGLYQTTDRGAAARALVADALSREPENALLKLLALDLDEEGTDEERDARRVAILEEESDPLVRAVSLFDFYASREDEVQAKKYLDEAEKLQPDNGAIIERQFRFAVSKKDWSTAKHYANKNKELNLDGTEGLMAEGRIELAKGNVDRAIDLMRQGLDKYPNYSLGWTYLADAYEKAERTADARDVLVEALKRDPTNGFANRALARIEVASGNQAESEKYLMAAARVLPNDPWVRHQLQLIKERENPEEGIKSREKARRENPKDVTNLVLLARLYGLPKVGQFDKAAEIYREALENATDDRELPLAREFASFLGREDVNRPSEGDALLTGLMTRTSDKSKKAEIAIHLGSFYEQQKQLATADRHFRLAVSLNPSRAILTSAGEYYSRTNRFRDAMEYYERALREVDEGSVEDRSIRARIIALTLALGDLDQARERIDTYVLRFPDSPQGMIYEGAYHRIAGDVEQARKSFDAHLEKNPDNAVALWQRGQLFMLMNQWQNAIDDLSRSKSYDLNGFNYQHRIALAHCFMEVGQREAAVSELSSILDEAPDQQAVAESLVDLYIRVGPSRYGDAENLIYTFSRKFPRDHKWPMLLGRVAELQGDADKAIQAYEKAAELSQFRRDTVGALFRVCRERNRPQVIIDYASERLSSRLLQTMPSALSALAWAYAKIGDETKALETYDRAIEAAANHFADFNRVVHQIVATFGLEEALAREKQRAVAEPDNLHRQKVLVHLLFLNKDLEGAYQLCKKIEELAAGDADTVFSSLAQGMLLEQMSKYEEAKENYEAALKLIPDDWFALNNLAYLLTDKLNRPAEAIPYAERAKKAAPTNPDVLDTLGWALFKDGRYGEALGVLLRALSVNRDDPMLLYHLAMVYQERGNLAEARSRLEAAEVIAKDRGNSELLSMIVQRLDEVKRAQ